MQKKTSILTLSLTLLMSIGQPSYHIKTVNCFLLDNIKFYGEVLFTQFMKKYIGRPAHQYGSNCSHCKTTRRSSYHSPCGPPSTGWPGPVVPASLGPASSPAGTWTAAALLLAPLCACLSWECRQGI